LNPLYYFCSPMNVFVLSILFYLAYRFIGGFIIPLFRTTKTMRQQFNNMGGQNTNPGAPRTEDPQASPGSTPKPNASKVGEYIDFEEIRG
jgi:hypothetical protein